MISHIINEVVHLHSREEHVIKNEDFKFVEDYLWIEESINKYIAEGYKVKQMVPNYAPSNQEEGSNTFFAGFTFYLEKEEKFLYLT